MARSLEEYRPLYMAAKEKGLTLGFGFKKMFAPANQKAKELKDDSTFGRVSM